MISIGPAAQAHFKRLIEQQDLPGMGVRLRVLKAGTPSADCDLQFCEPADLEGDELAIECEGFDFFLDAASVPFLDGAEIDYQATATGGQLTIRAPKIKGIAPNEDASLIERVRYVIDTEINPGLASHGGRVSVVSFEADGTLVLRFGGGCHGCGMVDVTLRDGIERTLKQRIPEVTGVRDATDHATGENPYVRRATR